MELILQKDDLPMTFELKWGTYVDTILKYAVSHKNPSKDLRHALREYTIDECESIDTTYTWIGNYIRLLWSHSIFAGNTKIAKL